MKKQLFLLLSFLITVASAQNPDDKKYLLTTNINTFELSTVSFLDPYLSPIIYSGIGMQYNHQIRSFLKPEQTNISVQSKLNLDISVSLNPQSTSMMMFMGANYSWGMHYHFRVQNGFQLLAGALWDVDFGFKEMPRNVNNPVNLDMATNLNLSGIAMYNFPLFTKTLRLQLTAQTPLLGYMFVPMGGASYYEMFELGNMSNTFHLSSPINKRGLNSSLTVAVPFNKSVWNFGFKYFTLKYTANDMVFDKNELSLVIGTTFDAANFSGRKNKAPKNFLSTNE